MSHGSAVAIRRDIAELLRPPRRVSVSQSAGEYLRVVDGGGNAAPWALGTTPYMQEPMDCLSSRQYDAVVFIGPSRSGKTSALVEGLQCYCRTCDPGDMLITQITEDKAREYSKIRIDRQLRNSPEMAKRISTRAHDDNVHDKIFKDGSLLSIKWPTKNTFASSDYRYVALTDYDRLPADIGGEGDPFSLASKRTQTFLSRGMTLVETSPGVPFTDQDWQRPADQPHLAPPVRGGMALFNQGDRRRLYWPCLHCGDFYQPIKENWNDELAKPECPHCGEHPEERQKRQLNGYKLWLPEGCHFSDSGKVQGQPRRTRIASFWMEGPAAAYQPWPSLSAKLLAAEETFEQTGSQETLQAVVNTDWGRPYTPKRLGNIRSAERLADRATIEQKRIVPKGVRFLTATVDVQGGKESRFVVQVHGWGPNRERWVIDRFNIKEDKGPDGKQAPVRVRPATQPEDWDILTRDLLPRTYTLEGERTKQMPIMMVGVDTGGEEGVTPQAYSWYRRLIREAKSRRVMLLKGATHKQQTRIRVTNPNSKAGARGDLPLYILATDELKDEVAAQLDREQPGPNFLHTPRWLGKWWYDELTAEERDADGKWRKRGKRPNEAFDLLAYDIALHDHIGANRIDWDNPPDWAKPWSQNPVLNDHGLLGATTRRRVRRRSSNYLG